MDAYAALHPRQARPPRLAPLPRSSLGGCARGLTRPRRPPPFAAHKSADLRKALLDAHDAGRPLVGLFSGLNSIQVPKLGADAGYDVVVVDAEHTAYTFGEVRLHR